MLTQHDKDLEKLESLRNHLAKHGGLTTYGWNDYNRLEKLYDPAAYDRRTGLSYLNSCKEYARKLTIEELEEIIAEKKKDK